MHWVVRHVKKITFTFPSHEHTLINWMRNFSTSGMWLWSRHSATKSFWKKSFVWSIDQWCLATLTCVMPLTFQMPVPKILKTSSCHFFFVSFFPLKSRRTKLLPRKSLLANDWKLLINLMHSVLQAQTHCLMHLFHC